MESCCVLLSIVKYKNGRTIFPLGFFFPSEPAKLNFRLLQVALRPLAAGWPFAVCRLQKIVLLANFSTRCLSLFFLPWCLVLSTNLALHAQLKGYCDTTLLVNRRAQAPGPLRFGWRGLRRRNNKKAITVTKDTISINMNTVAHFITILAWAIQISHSIIST